MLHLLSYLDTPFLFLPKAARDLIRQKKRHSEEGVLLLEREDKKRIKVTIHRKGAVKLRSIHTCSAMYFCLCSKTQSGISMEAQQLRCQCGETKRMGGDELVWRGVATEQDGVKQRQTSAGKGVQRTRGRKINVVRRKIAVKKRRDKIESCDSREDWQRRLTNGKTKKMTLRPQIWKVWDKWGSRVTVSWGTSWKQQGPQLMKLKCFVGTKPRQWS